MSPADCVMHPSSSPSGRGPGWRHSPGILQSYFAHVLTHPHGPEICPRPPADVPIDFRKCRKSSDDSDGSPSRPGSPGTERRSTTKDHQGPRSTITQDQHGRPDLSWHGRPARDSGLSRERPTRPSPRRTAGDQPPITRISRIRAVHPVFRSSAPSDPSAVLFPGAARANLTQRHSDATSADPDTYSPPRVPDVSVRCSFPGGASGRHWPVCVILRANDPDTV